MKIILTNGRGRRVRPLPVGHVGVLHPKRENWNQTLNYSREKNIIEKSTREWVRNMSSRYRFGGLVMQWRKRYHVRQCIIHSGKLDARASRGGPLGLKQTTSSQLGAGAGTTKRPWPDKVFLCWLEHLILRARLPYEKRTDRRKQRRVLGPQSQITYAPVTAPTSVAYIMTRISLLNRVHFRQKIESRACKLHCRENKHVFFGASWPTGNVYNEDPNALGVETHRKHAKRKEKIGLHLHISFFFCTPAVAMKCNGPD